MSINISFLYNITTLCRLFFVKLHGLWVLPRSSPADLPVPTQMPSPSAAFRDEEVTGWQIVEVLLVGSSG